MNLSKKLTLLLIITTVNAFASDAREYSPSFSCDAAPLQRVEAMICQNNELSRKDFMLNQIYSLALKRLKNIEEIKKSQRTWLLEVRNRCESVECLQRVYEGREIYLGALILPIGDFEIHSEWYGHDFDMKAWRIDDPNIMVKALNGNFRAKNNKDVVFLCDSVWKNHSGSVNTGYGGICWAEIDGRLGEYYICFSQASFNYEPVTIRNEYLVVRHHLEHCYGG